MKKTRLEQLESKLPEKAAQIRERQKKVDEKKSTDNNSETPSMTMTKAKLTEIAEKMNIDVLSTWIKSDILQAIENAG